MKPTSREGGGFHPRPLSPPLSKGRALRPARSWTGEGAGVGVEKDASIVSERFR